MDIYDEEDWTEMDIEDLKAAIEGGASIQEAADLLCRADGVEEVARKCAELGLKPKPKSWSRVKSSRVIPHSTRAVGTRRSFNFAAMAALLLAPAA